MGAAFHTRLSHSPAQSPLGPCPTTPHLALRPSVDAVPSTDLLQDGWTDVHHLGSIADGVPEVLGYGSDVCASLLVIEPPRHVLQGGSWGENGSCRERHPSWHRPRPQGHPCHKGNAPLGGSPQPSHRWGWHRREKRRSGSSHSRARRWKAWSPTRAASPQTAKVIILVGKSRVESLGVGHAMLAITQAQRISAWANMQ